MRDAQRLGAEADPEHRDASPVGLADRVELHVQPRADPVVVVDGPLGAEDPEHVDAVEVDARGARRRRASTSTTNPRRSSAAPTSPGSSSSWWRRNSARRRRAAVAHRAQPTAPRRAHSARPPRRSARTVRTDRDGGDVGSHDSGARGVRAGAVRGARRRLATSGGAATGPPSSSSPRSPASPRRSRSSRGASPRAGMTVAMPHLFGEDGREPTGGYLLRSITTGVRLAGVHGPRDGAVEPRRRVAARARAPRPRAMRRPWRRRRRHVLHRAGSPSR